MPSHVMQSTAKVGEKFPVQYIDGAAETVEVWINQSERYGIMRANRKPDTKAMGVKIYVPGVYTIDLKVNGSPSWYSMNITIE